MLLLALAALPTPLAAAQPAPAALKLSEVMPAPQGNLSEVEGEWVELTVEEGGQLGGIALSDLDGVVDFVFPALTVASGERLVVANGVTAPEGFDPSARLFLAGKSWWTFDNSGDDINVLAPDGPLMDRFAYGDGPAVDPPASDWPVAAEVPRAPPAGASFGRLENATAALLPTPGSVNIRLSSAQWHGFELAAVVLEGETAAPVVCPASEGSASAYLWSVAIGGSPVPFGAPAVAEGSCIAPPSLAGAAEGRFVEAAMGRPLAADPDSRAAPFTGGARVALLDPWGEVAFERALPPDQQAPARPGVLLLPCACPTGWLARALVPAPVAGAARVVEKIGVFPAGGALRSELMALLANATVSLDVNAYLMNSDAVEAGLRAAAVRGVQVRLLLEGAPVGGQQSHSPLDAPSLAAFNESGVWLRTFRAGPSSAERDHAKYLIGDRRLVAVLTENLVGAALSDEDPNIGYGAFCQCAALASDLEAVFDWDFDRGVARTAAPDWRALPGPVPATEASAGGTAALLVSPAPSPSPWTSLVAGARSSVRLEALSADLETLGPSSPLGRALLAAIGRGVHVQVLFSGDFEGSGGSQTLTTARALVAAAGPWSGLEVRALARRPGSNATLHAKVLVVDEARFILGSHNLVGSAFTSNREISLLVEEAGVALALAALTDGHFAGASEVLALGVALRPDAGLGAPAGSADIGGSVPPAFLGLLAAGSVALGWGLVKSPRLLLRARTSRGPPRRAFRRLPTSAVSGGHAPGPLQALAPTDEGPEPLEPPLVIGSTPPPEEPAAPPTVLFLPPTALDLLGRP